MVRFHHRAPAKPIRSGVMDIQSSPNALDKTAAPANAIRTIREVGYSTSSYATWINACLSNGLWPIPCFHTNYSDDATGRNSYVNDLNTTLGSVTGGPFYVELGNEPGTGDGNNSAAQKQTNRDNYLLMLTTQATSGGAIGKTAIDVVRSRGLRTCLAAITAKTGSFTALANDIDAASQGSSWSMFDAIAFHPYAQEPNDVENTLGTARGLIDAHTGAVGKPMMVTEVGWCCAVRSDGTNGGSPDDWNNQTPSWLGVPRSITLAEQADKINKGDSTGLWERIRSRSDLRLLALCWFGHQDYGLLPSGDGDGYKHCGLVDIVNGQRTAWSRLNAQPRFLGNTMAHYRA